MTDQRRIRRLLLSPFLVFLVAACTAAAQASPITMFRDPNCGCCLAWADHAHEGLEREVIVRDDVPMDEVKMRHGVPPQLASCHTVIVDGYVIEGHVPAADVARLLKEKPEGVRGLAVPGMPVGSPGMEMGDRTQPYQVIAFGDFGMRVFASYP